MNYKVTNTNLTLEVEGNTYTFRRILRKDVSKFKEKYDVVLEKFMECDAQVGEFMTEEKNVNLLKDLFKLMPCDECAEGFDKFELIEYDYALIARLFVSESFDESNLTYEIPEGYTFEPSAISRFNAWHHNRALGKAKEKAMEKALDEQIKALDKQTEIEKKRKALQTKMESLIT